MVRMQRLASKARFSWVVVALLVLVPAQLAVGARRGQAASRGALNRRLSKVKGRISDIRTQLRQVKIQERNVSGQLAVTQQHLEKAQDRVTSNKTGLARAQEELRIITARLVRTQRQLNRRGKLLSRRLVDIYQGDDIGYIDVLLRSRDMRTLASRGYYVRQIVSSDVALIKEIKRAREQIERDKKAQAAEVRQISELQAQLVEQRNSAAELTEDKAAQLDAIEHNRALYERMLAEATAESERIGTAIRRLQATPRGQIRYARRFTGGLALPVRGPITSRFGYRVHPITGVYSLHRGVDISCPSGTPVQAAADGEVILAGWMGAYGYAVVIDHGGGVSTLYGHNSKLLVGVGQQVKSGQVIARSGSTGWSTGPHVHFEKRVNGKPVSPM